MVEPSITIAIVVSGNPRTLEEHPDNHQASHSARIFTVQQLFQIQDSRPSLSEFVPPIEDELNDFKKSCHALEEMIKTVKYDQLHGQTAFKLFKDMVLEFIFKFEKEIVAIQISLSVFKANYFNSQSDLMLSHT